MSQLDPLRQWLQAESKRLASVCARGGRIDAALIDANGVAAFDLALKAADLEAAEALREYAQRAGGELEQELARLFAAEVSGSPLPAERYAAVAEQIAASGSGGNPGLDEQHSLFRQTFRDFANREVMPLATEIHRKDLLIPEKIIRSLAELGCFGLSIPERYGGIQPDDHPDNVAMVVITEELSRGSLGAAGSLITRPEILAKALLKGGTEEQRRTWLPRVASGELMVAVSVTEPDHGSDVANIRLRASPVPGGWNLTGEKIFATFAGRAELLLILARPDPDFGKGHRGLSMFLVQKPRYEGYSFAHRQEEGGRLEGKAIPTPGYRGMHSFSLSFEDYFVPAANLVGEDAGVGRGFYLQMEGFAGGRLQTAGRALGVMQSAFGSALTYAQQRVIFGKPIFDFQLARFKLARMAMLIQASRQLAYRAAREVDHGRDPAGVKSSMAKLFASRVAEVVTREAQQIHGGMGYAEESVVSRLTIDARVFSIFEGAEEVLALRVIARALLEGAIG